MIDPPLSVDGYLRHQHDGGKGAVFKRARADDGGCFPRPSRFVGFPFDGSVSVEREQLNDSLKKPTPRSKLRGIYGFLPFGTGRRPTRCFLGTLQRAAGNDQVQGLRCVSFASNTNSNLKRYRIKPWIRRRSKTATISTCGWSRNHGGHCANKQRKNTKLSVSIWLAK